MSDAISLTAILEELRRLPALVVGPGATSHAGIHDDIAKNIVDSLGINVDDTSILHYMTLLDEIGMSNTNLFPKAKEFARARLCNATPNPAIRSLVSVRWSAIVSLAPDTCLEDALREKYDSIASSWSVTIVDSAEIAPSRRTVPIYKLLGNPRDQRSDYGPVLDSSSYLMRKQSWSRILATFSDCVRDAPVLVLGMQSDRALLREFLASLFSLHAPHPKKFLFFVGDAIREDPIVTSLLHGKARFLEMDATLKEFCAAMADFGPPPVHISISLPAQRDPSAKEVLDSALQPFSSYLQVVPHEKPGDFDPSFRTHELIDSLFRPTTLDWTPYLFDYFLPRSQVTVLTDSIKDHFRLSGLTRMSCFVLKGEAGSGKTCLMRQAAIEMARSGFVVLWLKRLPPEANHSVYRELSRALSQTYKTLRKESFPRIVLFCDEHWNLRVVPHDLAYELNVSSSPVSLVFSFRNTDLLSESGLTLSLPVIPDEEIELAYELDNDELEALPALLFRVNAFSDSDSAKRAISQMATRHAADILCSLWYLIPQTRASLSLALEDEYFRLGNPATTVAGVAEAAREFGEKARIAYECVAVCSAFQIGIPTEVLVRVLDISFDEWNDMCTSGKPLWGLIYPDENSETEEVIYVTRNEVVTTILLGILNGGHGHSGEFRRLKDLISVCTIGTPPYRTFLMDILVRNRRKLLERFTLSQGMEMFELARNTFPYPDKTIEHQYGVWLKDNGADSTVAYEQLERALQTPDYPHASSSERPEHIHTTLAAVVVSQVRDGSRTPESGLEEVRERLRHAQSPSFFNPHTTHVFGSLLLEFASMHREGESMSIMGLEAVAEAIPAIERAMQVIGASGARMRRYERDLEMLTSLQKRLLDSIMDVETLKKIAQELFDANRSQIGFEVVARKLLYDASEKNRGRTYLQVKKIFG